MIKLAPRADGGRVYLDDGDNVVTVRPLHPKKAALELPAPSNPKLSPKQKLAEQVFGLSEDIAKQNAEISRLNYLLHEERRERDTDRAFFIANEDRLKSALDVELAQRQKIEGSLHELSYAHSNLRAGKLEAALKHIEKLRASLNY